MWQVPNFGFNQGELGALKTLKSIALVKNSHLTEKSFLINGGVSLPLFRLGRRIKFRSHLCHAQITLNSSSFPFTLCLAVFMPCYLCAGPGGDPGGVFGGSAEAACRGIGLAVLGDVTP